MNKYWLALAAGAVGVVLLIRRKSVDIQRKLTSAEASLNAQTAAARAAATTAAFGCGCGCGSCGDFDTDPHSGLPIDGYGNIDALPQEQVFVDALQRYERAGTR